MGTLAGHRYPRAACNNRFLDAGINVGTKVEQTLAGKKPLVDKNAVPENPSKSNLILFELFELKGFLQSPHQEKNIFVEFTPNGPELFLFTDARAERCDKSILPDDRYVRINRELASTYSHNERILNDVLSMVSFERDGWKKGVSFMRIDACVSAATGATHYFPISSAYSYGIITSFEFPTHVLLSTYKQEAKDAEQQGKKVYTADREFGYGQILTFEQGYHKNGEEHYVVIPFKPKISLPRAYRIQVQINGDIVLKTK